MYVRDLVPLPSVVARWLTGFLTLRSGGGLVILIFNRSQIVCDAPRHGIWRGMVLTSLTLIIKKTHTSTTFVSS